MRNRFVDELVARAASDERVFLVVGDLGYSVVEPFSDRFPGRFLNVGVAEQNMTGIAAGLAREGYKVFTYSIANFPTLRCLEQIRNDVCYHGLDVTIAAVGGGFMYGTLGASHHATEDIGILRVLPGMRVYAPGLPEQMPAVVDEILSGQGPAYLRLGRACAFDPADFRPFAGGWVGRRRGSRVAVVTVGNVASLAGRLPLPEGIVPDVWIAGRVKPMPREVVETLAAYDEIHVVEDHQRSGGMYSILAERFCGRSPGRGGRPAIASHAIADAFPDRSANEAALQEAMIVAGPEGYPPDAS
jgi:transketolase